MNNWEDYYLGLSKIPGSQLRVHGMDISIEQDTSTGFWKCFVSGLSISEVLPTKDIAEAKAQALQIVSEKLTQISFAIRELQNNNLQ